MCPKTSTHYTHTHKSFDCLRPEKKFIHGPKRVHHTRNNTPSYDIDIDIIIIIIIINIIIYVVDLLLRVLCRRRFHSKYRQIVLFLRDDIMETDIIITLLTHLRNILSSHHVVYRYNKIIFHTVKILNFLLYGCFKLICLLLKLKIEFT